MPLPTPRASEAQAAFVQRCMADDVSRADFPEVDRRYPMYLAQWREGRSDDALPKD